MSNIFVSFLRKIGFTVKSWQESVPSDVETNKELPSSFTPQELFEALGVEVVKDNGADLFTVGFQGGYFQFNCSKTHISIIYPNFSSCTYSEIVKASLVANNLNCKYLGWTCYLSVNEHSKEENAIDICMSYLVSRTCSLNEQVEYIRNILLLSFSIAREYRADLLKAKRDRIPLEDYYTRKDFMHKLSLVQRMNETWLNSEEKLCETQTPLTIDSLVNLIDSTQLGCIIQLQIVMDNEIQCISDVSKIKEWDIREFIIHSSRPQQLDKIMLVIGFEKQSLLVHLKKIEGSTDKCFIYLMQISRTGTTDDLPDWNDDSLTSLSTIAVRLTTEQEDYWEVKYMLDDAKEKRESGREQDLSDEQRVMLDQISPGLYSDAYWARKFFNKGCMIQSLFHFKRVYASVVSLDRGSKKSKDMELEYAFYLGVIYLQLKQYERAFYYLHSAKDSNKLVAIQYYILCRNYLKDSTVEAYINELMVALVEELYTATEPDPAMISFYAFLNRQMVVAIENSQEWDRAETLLQKMMDRHQDIDFVKKELQRIRKMRKVDQSSNSED